MKNKAILFCFAIGITTSVSADVFEMDQTVLREGKVSNNQKCVTVASGFTVKAFTSKGRVTTYKANNKSHGHGIYVGAPSGLPYTVANTTAPSDGTYQLTFEPAVTKITLTLDWITNQFSPAEKLSSFSTENGAVQIKYIPNGNTTIFQGNSIISNSNRGSGVLIYKGKPFKN